MKKKSGTCSYCSVKAIRRYAFEFEEEIVEVADSFNGHFINGIKFYSYPKGVLFSNLSEVEREKYFTGWFAEVSYHCICEEVDRFI